MNREQRRKTKQNKAPAVYQISADGLEQIRQEYARELERIQQEYVREMKEVRTQAINDTFRLLIQIPLIVLHGVFGFGPERRERFLQHVELWLSGLEDGTVTMEEIRETCRTECGTTVEMEDDDIGK